MKILIGADIVPTKSNKKTFEDGDAVSLVGEELVSILNSADYRIFNLEVPLADNLSPIEKCGPALIAPTSTIAGYKALGVDCVTIANNHIMDQGTCGFESTVQTLCDNDIAYVGGGANLSEASKTFVFNCDGKKIGIYACAEHEFSIATETTPGANPFDPLESLDDIVELKAECDYVIVLYHGGKEHYRYPSPNLQKVCRKMVEKGANLVICQHSHCIGCEEKYRSGTIVYGQGNFIFDASESEYWQTGLLVQINDDFSVSYIPIKKQDNFVRLAQDDLAKAIMDSFSARSSEINDNDFVEIKYEQYAESMIWTYLGVLNGVNFQNIVFRLLNRITGYRYIKWRLRKIYTKEKLLNILNFIDCEVHRELLLKSLSNMKKL